MIITNGNLKNTGDQLFITFDNPFTNVKTIDGFSDVISVNETDNNFILREFSYSYDNAEWSEYIELDDMYLQQIQPNTKSSNVFYIKFRYTKEGTDNILIVVNQFNFNVTYNTTPKYQNNTCTSECVSCNELVITSENNFNPYLIDGINCVQNQLTLAITNVYGLPSTYWRTLADEESGDVIFKEYSLYNREPSKCIKVVVPDNKLPDNDTQFTMMDMDFLDLPFEVQISRQEWENVYGKRTSPKRKDAIYIELIDKMFLVDSCYLNNELGSGKGVYFNVNLIKWQNESNIDMPLEVEQEIRDLILSSEDVFGEEFKEEVEKISKPDQYKINTLSNLNNDNYIVDNKVIYDIIDNIENNWTVISDSCYNLSNSNTVNAVTYPNKTISLTSSLSVVFWVKLLDTTFGTVKANNGTEGFNIAFNNKNIVITNNGITNTFVTNTNLDLNKWYGIIINMSSKFNQLNLSIYKIADNNKYSNTENVDSKLIQLFSSTKIITNTITFTNALPSINSGKYKFTNLRIFDKMIPDIKHSTILNQNIVVDSNRALLIDNAIKPLNMVQEEPHK